MERRKIGARDRETVQMLLLVVDRTNSQTTLDTIKDLAVQVSDGLDGVGRNKIVHDGRRAVEIDVDETHRTVATEDVHEVAFGESVLERNTLHMDVKGVMLMHCRRRRRTRLLIVMLHVIRQMRIQGAT